MPFNIGDNVLIKYSTMTGVIVGAGLDDAGNYYYLVDYTDNDGVAQERYFAPDQLQAV